MGLILSVGFILLGLAIWYFKPFKTFNRVALLLPSIFVLTYYLSSWLFSLLLYAPKYAPISAYMDVGNFGLPLSSLPIVGGLSQYVGLYGMAFIAVLFNLFLWHGFHKRKILYPFIALFILMAISLLSIILPKPSSIKPISVAVDQEVAASENGSMGLKARLAASPTAKQVTVMVLPEYFNYSGVIKPSDGYGSVFRSVATSKGVFIYGAGGLNQSGSETNSIAFSDVNGNFLDNQEKTLLVPTGEYIPQYFKITVDILGLGQYIKSYSTNNDVIRGSNPAHVFTYNNLNYGSLNCYSAFAPVLYRNLSNQGANILTNSASLTFTQDSSILQGQLKETLHFISLANYKPMLVSSRAGHSYIFAANGTVVSATKDVNNNVIYGSIHPTNGRTLYDYLGEYFLLISLVILIAYTLYDIKISKNKRK
jgi:apolipoprotein N-acyltransferase